MATETITLVAGTRGFDKADAETQKLTRSLKDLRRQTVETRGALVTLGRIVVPAMMFKAAQGVVNLTDAFTNLQNKIRVVTKSQESLNYITGELLKIANESRTGFESVATVYSRTARSVEILGKSQQETLQFTKTLSKAVAIGGSTAVEASNAMIQLSQGLSSGTLRGDELRSVLEQLPVVADLIAAGMGKNLGELRKLGAAGKLTSEAVFSAVIKGSEEVDAKFAKLKLTFAQAWEVLSNKALFASQAFQKSVGDMSQLVLHLADNFDVLMDAAQSAAQVVGVIFAVTAINAAVRGMNLLTAAMARNPIGVIAVGVVAAAAALGPFLHRMEVAEGKATRLKDIFMVLWDDHMKRIKPIGDLLKKYIIDPISEWTGSLEGVLILLSKIVDVMRNMIDLPLAMKQTMVFFNRLRGSETGTTMGPEGSRTELAVRDVLNRAEQMAIERNDAQMFADRKKLSENALEAMRASLPGTPGKLTPAGAKTSGKSAADLIRELREAIAVLRAPDTKERNIQKILESTLDQLGKNQVASPGQKEIIEHLIRIQEDLKEGMKISEEMGKHISESMTKSLQERKEAMEKASLEAGKSVSEGRNAAAKQLRESDAAVMRDLDPLADYKERVQALEDFKLRHTEMTNQVDNEIVKMSAGYQKFAPIFESMSTSVADAAANAIVFGDNMVESLDRIAKSLASQVLSTGFQLAMGAAVGAIGGPKLPGFASGGYTGNGGHGDVAGVVHGREFVMNAGATARNRSALEAMNNGGSVDKGMKVNVHNYGSNEVEVNQVSRTEIEVMIRKGIKQHAPKVVADDMRGSNSSTSKALKTSYETRARR